MSMSEEEISPEPDTIGENQAKLSRRGVLKLLGITITAAALKRSSSEEKDVDPDILRAEIENQFGIEVKTYGEVNPSPNETATDLEYFPSAWRVDQLKRLQQFLPVLPEHFYKSPGSVKKLIVYGGIQSYHCRIGDTEGCPILYQGEPYKAEQPIIAINYGILEPDGGKSSLEMVSHECTHSIVDNGHEEMHPDARTAVIKSWYAELENILGKRYKGVYDQLFGKIETAKKEKTGNREQQWFYIQLAYAFSNPSEPSEFIPILAERYLHGRSDFEKRYSEFFPRSISRALYDFTKDKVFRGKEYNSFPLDLPRS